MKSKYKYITKAELANLGGGLHYATAIVFAFLLFICCLGELAMRSISTDGLTTLYLFKTHKMQSVGPVNRSREVGLLAGVNSKRKNQWL